MALPPTLNHLNDKEKARLIRSTRKLGAILGTTVVLQDAPSAPESKLHRSHSSTSNLVYVSLPPTSPPESPHAVLSFDTKRSFEKKSRPPLYVQVEHRGGRASLGDTPMSTTASSLSRSSTISSVISLISPPPPIAPPPLPPASLRRSTSHASTTSNNTDPSIDARRKKLAKLKRTLGENVPQELVFRASSPSPPAIPSPHTHKHSQSHYHLDAPGVTKALHFRKGRSMSVTSFATDNLVKRTYPASAITEHKKHKPKPFSPYLLPPVQVHITTSSDANINLLSSLPKRNSSLHNDNHHLHPDVYLESAEWGKRKEREWSGEWNVQDIGDVVKGLRDLKLKGR